MPEGDVANIVLELTEPISSDNSTKTSGLSPLVVASSKTSGLSTHPQLPAAENDSIQDQLIVAEIDNPPFQIISCVKSPYYCIKPRKVWKDSQPIAKFDGEYMSSVTELIQLRSPSEWGGSKALRLSQDSGE